MTGYINVTRYKAHCVSSAPRHPRPQSQPSPGHCTKCCCCGSDEETGECAGCTVLSPHSLVFNNSRRQTEPTQHTYQHHLSESKYQKGFLANSWEILQSLLGIENDIEIEISSCNSILTLSGREGVTIIKSSSPSHHSLVVSFVLHAN